MILAAPSGAAAVAVSVSSSLRAARAAKRFPRGLTLAELKLLPCARCSDPLPVSPRGGGGSWPPARPDPAPLPRQCKLELVVGSPASCMDLELYAPDDKFIMKLDSDEALLGSYPVDDGCRIHVVDRSGAQVGEYEDLSRVEKYEISDTSYEKRADSVRSFLKRSKKGRFNEEEVAQKEAEQAQKLAEEKALAEAITVGARCEVRMAGQPLKRGTVMYVGLAEFKPGYWIGIKYDEPLGKHDGSVNGQRYFECQPKYGAFVKPQHITVGDFPEEDYGLEDEM